MVIIHMPQIVPELLNLVKDHIVIFLLTNVVAAEQMM
jgi:hypothetical protein